VCSNMWFIHPGWLLCTKWITVGKYHPSSAGKSGKIFCNPPSSDSDDVSLGWGGGRDEGTKERMTDANDCRVFST
jgi:hypothetical protein